MSEEPVNNDEAAAPAGEGSPPVSAASPASEPMVYHADGRRQPSASLPPVAAYDFRNPVFLTEGEMRNLRTIHEDFSRYLSTRLALFLRMEFSLKLTHLTTLHYAKFTEGLSSPAHLCLFKAEPLYGVGIVHTTSRLALTLVDRMLGGRAQAAKAERSLTEIETALFEDVLRIVLEEWCGQWRGEVELRSQIIGHETSGRYLQTSSKDESMLVVTLQVELGDCSESMQIGVPYSTIEPMVKARQTRLAKELSPGKTAARAEWKPLYEHIALPAHAEWDAYELSLRELMNLRVGDVLALPADIVDRTRFLIAGDPKFTGTVGLEGDHVVVKLTEQLTREDPSHANAHSR